MSPTLRVLSLSLLSVSGLVLFAGEPPQVRWNDLCSTARGREMVITTDSQETISGYCVGISVDEVSVRRSDGRIIRVARDTLSRFQIHRRRSGSQLKELGRDMKHSLRDGAGLVFSPMAPAGLIIVPGTLAWGAIAAPFCVLGDVFFHTPQDQEYRVI